MAFEGLAESAAESYSGSQSQQPTDPQTKTNEQDFNQSGLNGSAPDLKSFNDNQGQDKQSARAAQALLDLSKQEKFLFEGKEMTPRELKEAILRREDYTRKTQDLSRERQEIESARKEFEQERTFSANYEADLQKVLSNPEAYLNKFLEVYPKKYHEQMFSDLQRQSQGSQNQGSPNPHVDSKYLQLYQKNLQIEETLNSLMNDRTQERVQSVDQSFANLEQKLTEKYPDAHLGDVYTALQKYAKDNNISIQSMSDQGLSQMHKKMEELTKASHDYFDKRYSERSKSQAKAQIDANKKGADIGRGGGTPTQAPPKMKLRDVGDHMIEEMKRSGVI